MNLCYVTPFHGPDFPQIAARVDEMAAVWTTLGHDADVRPLPATSGRSNRNAAANFWIDFRRTRVLVERVTRCPPDAVVLRHYLPIPSLVSLAQAVPTFLEVHNDDLAEYRRTSRARWVLAHVARKRYLSAMRGSFFVTSETASSPTFRMLPGPRMVLGNSVPECETVPPPPDGRPLVFYSCGNDLPWQGLDLVPQIAAGLPDVDFVVAVPARVGSSLPAPATPNVSVVAGDDPAVHESWLRKASLCLGTLALGRSGRTIAAPLKVREAVGRGIPVLLPYRDEQLIAARDPCVIVRPELDGCTELLIQSIRESIPRVRGRRVSADTRASIATGMAEKKRLDLIRQVLST